MSAHSPQVLDVQRSLTAYVPESRTWAVELQVGAPAPTIAAAEAACALVAPGGTVYLVHTGPGAGVLYGDFLENVSHGGAGNHEDPVTSHRDEEVLLALSRPQRLLHVPASVCTIPSGSQAVLATGHSASSSAAPTSSCSRSAASRGRCRSAWSRNMSWNHSCARRTAPYC